MRFAKYQGLGNDFLVVDLRAASERDAAAAQDPANVIALCDRQFGIGGDGVLAVLPPVTSGADARMRVLNSDGSEAEMCGNGLRCVAVELFDRGGIRKDSLAIDTGAGVLRCDVDARDAVRAVTVDMGAPRLARAEIPAEGPPDERWIDLPLALTGYEPVLVTCVSMGNPHAVAFVESAATARRRAETLGPLVEHHRAFPRRTNVELAHVASRTEIDLVVWERGVGITLACGTGACATVVAAILTGRADEATPVRVNLPGGPLEITVAKDLATVSMKGPASLVFDGELALESLRRRP